MRAGDIRSWLDDWGHAFSDVRYEKSLAIELDDVIVAETTYRSTQTGPLPMPDGSVVPPTGKTLDTRGVTILTVKDGKVVAARDYIDQSAGMMQLGLLPNP
jgi:ketosteroid isomerase-like protein